jgi:cysteinyl-tRNA synthetase
MVTVDGVKFGKSLGNFITLKEAFKKYDPMTIRLFVLQSHYRSPLDFSEAALKAAGSGWQRVNNTWHALKKESQNASAGKETLDLSGYTEAFNAAMNNDFNTPKALAVVFDLIKEYNRLKNENKKLDGESRNNLLRFFEVYLGGVLGLKAEAVSDNSYEKLAGVIELLLRLRQDFRAQGNYARADEIRDQLLRLGIRIKDGSRGSEWEFID